MLLVCDKSKAFLSPMVVTDKYCKLLSSGIVSPVVELESKKIESPFLTSYTARLAIVFFATMFSCSLSANADSSVVDLNGIAPP